ncbi:MAG: hypothetical protein G3I09_00110 [Ferrovum sp.]|nr:hypothetical protein [Ferrovum sp.]
MKISDYFISPEHPPFIIAEVAQSHEGSLGMALSFIEVAAECGVHAIKFQTHLAEEESTPREPWRIPFSPQDASRYDYWQRLAFTLEQWALLKAHAERLGLVFLSSPFPSRRVTGWNLWAWWRGNWLPVRCAIPRLSGGCRVRVNPCCSPADCRRQGKY